MTLHFLFLSTLLPLITARDFTEKYARVETSKLLKEFSSLSDTSYPWKSFSRLDVDTAKSKKTNWTARGAVTPAKDQGNHGYCGTFGRVAAAEGQYALRSGQSLASFSEQELVSCVGWDRVPQQFDYFSKNGFMTTAAFPYNQSGKDMDPPVLGQPCIFQEKLAVVGSGAYNFTNSTGPAIATKDTSAEDQMVAFIFKNGPVQTGIASDVFGLRVKGCESDNSCFITPAMCSKVAGQNIDHSITIVGYGTDPILGDYWDVKNSWSTAFANQGFIKVARGTSRRLLDHRLRDHSLIRSSPPPSPFFPGISCAQIDCCLNIFTYGDASTYFN